MKNNEKKSNNIQTKNGFKNEAKNLKKNLSNGKSSSTNDKKEDENTNLSPMSSIIHHYLMPGFLLLFSPNLTLLLWFVTTKCNGSFTLLYYNHFANKPPLKALLDIWGSITFGSIFSMCLLLGYITWSLIMQLLVPGKRVTGPTSVKGHVPSYKDNGFSCFIITMITFVLLTCGLKHYGYSPTVVYDRFDEILVTMTAFSLIFCLFLYFKGIYFPSGADSGSTGNFIFDFYWGTELYPRILGVDVKVFTNCRFGMTAWPLIVCICALKSYEVHGFIVDGVFVSTVLQLLYLGKFFWWEAGYMRTIDIMLDRAGFYICWGCLCYIAGVYGSVSLYFATRNVVLGPVLTSTLLFVGIMSIIINYLADAQKLQVRNSDAKCLIWGNKPEIIRAKYVLENGEEKSSILLTNGWWGLARHFHYLPELILALCWTLPAGFENLLPYTYFIWLFCLLVHRTFRDDRKCSKKYGTYWSQYCKKVPYKIIPGLF